MILDSSVIVAMVLAEPGHEELLEKVGTAGVIGLGAPTAVEAGIVLSARLHRDARQILDELLREVEASVIPFDEVHWRVSVEAFLRYGKGRHPAALNFGDCMSYAVATVSGQPLLFSGEDFSQTDVQQA